MLSFLRNLNSTFVSLLTNYYTMKYFTFTLTIFLFTLNFHLFYAQQTDESLKKTEQFKPEVKFGGRIHYDFEFLKQKQAVEDYTLSGQEFRRVYITASGSVSENIKFKAEIDVAQGKVGYRDVFIELTKIPGIGGNLIFGSQAEPSGFESLLGSNYIPFIEKTPITATQTFRWNSGIGYENFGILKGKLALQMTYGFNGYNTEGFVDKNIDKGGHFVGRLSSPVYFDKENHTLMHLGMHYEHRKYTENPTDYTLKFRPENHLGNTINVLISNLDYQQDFGFEIAAQKGPLSFHAEYEDAGYHREFTTSHIKGYYALVSYFLTGDYRSYKEGLFSRVTPRKNLNWEQKTWGAFEVLARYSGFDYSDLVTSGYNDRVNSLALGLNWYLNANSRLMYNYVISDLHETGDNNKLNQHLFRIQVDF